MLKPPALKPSSVIGIFAPASPVRREFLERGMQEIRRLGFRTRLGKGVFTRTRYTAGEAAIRVSDLLDLWEDPEVDAVFCARGGYGSLDMLERLDAARFRDRPKILLGSSDVTALLCFLMSRVGLICFHGPMVAQQIARGDGAYDTDSLVGVLSRREPWGNVSAPGIRSLHAGEAEGVLMGGCLSLVTALVGTPYLPSFDGAILFLEDTGVRPYQVDRMLRQLRLSGWLKGVRGLVFGEMPDCEQHPEQGYRIDELLADLTADLGVPVLFGLPSGHTLRPAWTLPLGVRARIGTGGLSLLEGAVD